MFRTLKYRGAKHLQGSCPTEFAGSTQNPKKKVIKRQINKSQRTFFKKKLCFVPQKCKGAKNLQGSYPKEFAGSTQIVFSQIFP
jgi:hypothetical protein